VSNGVLGSSALGNGKAFSTQGAGGCQFLGSELLPQTSVAVHFFGVLGLATRVWTKGRHHQKQRLCGFGLTRPAILGPGLSASNNHAHYQPTRTATPPALISLSPWCKKSVGPMLSMQFSAKQHLVLAKVIRKNAASLRSPEREQRIKQSNGFLACLSLSAQERGGISLSDFDWEALNPDRTTVDDQIARLKPPHVEAPSLVPGCGPVAGQGAL
jgi:hypothetical protein